MYIERNENDVFLGNDGQSCAIQFEMFLYSVVGT